MCPAPGIEVTNTFIEYLRSTTTPVSRRSGRRGNRRWCDRVAGPSTDCARTRRSRAQPQRDGTIRGAVDAVGSLPSRSAQRRDVGAGLFDVVLQVAVEQLGRYVDG